MKINIQHTKEREAANRGPEENLELQMPTLKKKDLKGHTEPFCNNKGVTSSQRYKNYLCSQHWST